MKTAITVDQSQKVLLLKAKLIANFTAKLNTAT